MRSHLELLIREVAQKAGPRPYSVPTYCALACVGVACRELGQTPRPVLEARVAHARLLARSIEALADHYERLGGAAS